MADRPIDFRHSLEVLKNINDLKLKGTPLINSFFFDSYNVWQTFQAKLFAIIQYYDFSAKPPRETVQQLTANFMLAGATALLLSLMAYLALILRRKRVLVYSMDKADSKFSSDERLDHVYEALARHREPFTEIFHTLLGSDFRKNILRRKRPAIYLEAADFLFVLLVRLHIIALPRVHSESLALDHIQDENERAFALRIFTRFSYQSELFRFKARMLSKLLRVTSVTHLLTIDEMRNYFELLYACRKNGIKSYAFEHGSYTKYHVGWLKAPGAEGKIIKPDKLFVWSPYWKNELHEFGTYFESDELVVGGRKNIPDAWKTRKPEKRNGPVIVVPHERAASKAEVRHFIRMFLNCGAQVLFKVRPGVDRAAQLAQYDLRDGEWEGLSIIDSMVGLEDADIVAGTTSSLLYDAIAWGRPVVYLQTNVRLDERLVANDLAEPLATGDAICERLVLFARIPEAKRMERRKKLLGEEPVRVADTLDEILTEVRQYKAHA